MEQQQEYYGRQSSGPWSKAAAEILPFSSAPHCLQIQYFAIESVYKYFAIENFFCAIIQSYKQTFSAH